MDASTSTSQSPQCPPAVPGPCSALLGTPPSCLSSHKPTSLVLKCARHARAPGASHRLFPMPEGLCPGGLLAPSVPGFSSMSPHQRSWTWQGQQPPPSHRPSPRALVEKMFLELFVCCPSLPKQSSSPARAAVRPLDPGTAPTHDRPSGATCRRHEQHRRANRVRIDGSSQPNAAQLCAGASQPPGVRCAGQQRPPPRRGQPPGLRPGRKRRLQSGVTLEGEP